MIFLTAILLGMTAVALRSIFSIIFVCLLVVATFAAAAAVSAGPVHAMALVHALAGYNLGVVGVVAGLLFSQRLRSQSAASRR